MCADQLSTQNKIVKLISIQKNLSPSLVLPHIPLNQLGVDMLDLFHLILVVEKIYGVNIPDDVPLHTVNDFVNFIYAQAKIRNAS